MDLATTLHKTISHTATYWNSFACSCRGDSFFLFYFSRSLSRPAEYSILVCTIYVERSWNAYADVSVRWWRRELNLECCPMEIRAHLHTHTHWLTSPYRRGMESTHAIWNRAVGCVGARQSFSWITSQRLQYFVKAQMNEMTVDVRAKVSHKSSQCTWFTRCQFHLFPLSALSKSGRKSISDENRLMKPDRFDCSDILLSRQRYWMITRALCFFSTSLASDNSSSQIQCLTFVCLMFTFRRTQ